MESLRESRDMAASASQERRPAVARCGGATSVRKCILYPGEKSPRNAGYKPRIHLGQNRRTAFSTACPAFSRPALLLVSVAGAKRLRRC